MLACKNLNRNGIGIELDEVYFNTAVARVDGEKIKENSLQKTLFDAET